MSKTKRVVDSDDEDQDSSVVGSAHKRARTSKNEAGPSGDKDYTGMDVDESDDEQEYKSDIEEDARAREGATQLLQRKKQEGTTAEAGIITRVELVNFMCHKNLSVDLGPKLNFIYGSNGSGKSTILTAITIALGGMSATRSTNRGTNYGSFVNYDRQSGEIAVHIRNKGEEAFKPELYGDRIVVRRRLVRGGASTLKLENKATGKVVATKRDDLNAMMDHFGIQVDNPMNILSQDNARQFIGGSSPKDKYQFFLRGTQLQQLTEEYARVRAQINSLVATVKQKKDGITDLKQKYTAANEAWKQVEQARDFEHRLVQLKQEVAWCYVQEAEQKVGVVIDEVAEAQSLMKRYEDAVLAEKQKLEDIERRIAEVQTRRNDEESEEDGFEAEINQIKADMQANTAALNVLRREINEMNDESKAQQATVRKCDSDIKAERDKMGVDVTAKRDRAQAKIDQSQATLDECEAALIEVRSNNDGLKQAHEAARARDQELASEVQSAERERANCANQVNNIDRATANAQTVWGQDIPRITQTIKSRTWKGPILGPIGSYVQLKDPKWGLVMESVIGRTLQAYIVTDREDERTLQSLFRQSNWARNHNIIFQRPDPTFDCSGGEPSAEFLTMLRAADITEDLVKQALVVSNKIESAILVENRREGDQIMRHAPYNVSSCYTPDCFRVGGFAGGAGNMALNKPQHNRFSRDLAADRVRAVEAANQAEQVCRQAQASVQQARDEVRRHLNSLQQNSRRGEELQRKIRSLKTDIERAQEDLVVEEPVNVQAWEELRADAQAKVDDIKIQFQLACERKEAHLKANDPHKARLDEIKQIRDDKRNGLRRFDRELDELTKDRVTVDKAIAHYSSKAKNEGKRVEHLQQKEATLTEALQAVIDSASEFVARELVQVDPRKTSERYIKDIRAVEQARDKITRAAGGSVEKIQQDRERAKANYLNVKNSIDGFEAYIRTSEKSLSLRTERWGQFRTLICSRARMHFLYHLSTRGFQGKIVFDHEGGRLDLRIAPEDTSSQSQGSQKVKQKDVKGLSGGEKSYATLCLLLTLWEAIGCPVRGLDEFDVFMDTINRGISMGMLSEVAKSTDNTQFIIITPQSDNGQYKFKSWIRMLKIDDPDRTQGTLAAGANH